MTTTPKPTPVGSKRHAALLPGGIPRWVRCYDNEGRSFDRYTVLYTGRGATIVGPDKRRYYQYVSMSAHPAHPQGFGQHEDKPYIIDTVGGKWPPALGRSNHLGKRVRFENLPDDCQKMVLSDYKAIWNLA